MEKHIEASRKARIARNRIEIQKNLAKKMKKATLAELQI